MIQKLSFGKIEFIFKRIVGLIQRLNPRYQLSLDHDYFDIKEKDRKYRFKSFGDHSFPEFTFKQIKFNESILFTVNPHDLIKIAEKNSVQENLKSLLKIEELLRNNKYKLSNTYGSNIFSGDEICDNPLLADQIEKMDLFKIAYNTGFERGRKLSKFLTHEAKKENSANNIVELKVLSKTNSTNNKHSVE